MFICILVCCSEEREGAPQGSLFWAQQLPWKSLMYTEQSRGSLWGALEMTHVRLVSLLQPRFSGHWTWHQTLGSLPTLSPILCCFSSPAVPRQVTSLKVMNLFWGIKVWAQAEWILGKPCRILGEASS